MVRVVGFELDFRISRIYEGEGWRVGCRFCELRFGGSYVKVCVGTGIV